MRRYLGPAAGLVVTATTLFLVGTAAAVKPPVDKVEPPPSGTYDFRDVNYGTRITECPQAGMNTEPEALDRRERDAVERISDRGDDVRTNTEYSCFPQDETSVAINPCTASDDRDDHGDRGRDLCVVGRNSREHGDDDDCRAEKKGDHWDAGCWNVVSGQNDYRMGWGTSGLNTTPNFFQGRDDRRDDACRDRDGRESSHGSSSDDHRYRKARDACGLWYDFIAPFPTLPSGDNLDGGGDPALVFDRAGVAYYVDINFNRTDDTSGIWTRRSTNGGFTWSRPCVPIDATPADPTDDQGRCGGTGDPRQPGDGTVTFQRDNDFLLNGSVPFEDKEYVAAGPRPAGVQPTCFGAFTRTPRPCDPDVIGVDRIYVTWTRFATNGESLIMLSYSDDQARSWSPPRVISGSATFCSYGIGNSCDFNQFSNPTVNPHTGLLGVAFENYNTEEENQYLFVRSRDGGLTFEGPFFVTPVFDVNYPRSGAGGTRNRPDCAPRGQQNGRPVLTNSCFRVNSGGNVVVDKRGGEFADDFYLVMSDNRNGTKQSSNTDVFFFRSTDGGTTWIGPSRVNNDRSQPPANFECGNPFVPPAQRVPCPEGTPNYGNDQWFPWVDISKNGVLAFGFFDRRLDTDSVASEWPTSRQRPGNYLTWFWGAGCAVTRTERVTASMTTVPAGARECVAPGATPIPQPTGLINPGGTAPVPGQGPMYLGPFANQVISDVPSNMDYAFRAGIFIGDYNNVAFPNLAGHDGRSGSKGHDDEHAKKGDLALGFWTDARNGRGSGNPTNPATFQPGRNPACEQSDVFIDAFNPLRRDDGRWAARYNERFLVTPCPADAAGDHGHDND